MDKSKTYKKASSFALEHKFSLAMRLIDKYLFNFPDDTDLLILKGNILDIQLKHNKSIKLYKKVLSLNQNNIFALIDLGDAYRNKEQYKKAIKYYDMVITLIQDNDSLMTESTQDEYIDACLGKVETLLLLNKPFKAIDCINYAIKKCPTESYRFSVFRKQVIKQIKI